MPGAYVKDGDTINGEGLNLSLTCSDEAECIAVFPHIDTIILMHQPNCACRTSLLIVEAEK